MTPEEAWSGKKPDLGHIQIIGSKAFAHIPHELRKKWITEVKKLFSLDMMSTLRDTDY
jgi:hypothetical protein